MSLPFMHTNLTHSGSFPLSNPSDWCRRDEPWERIWPENWRLHRPARGVYAFSWTIHAAGLHLLGSKGNHGEVTASLTQHGITKGSFHVDAETKWDDASSTGFAILSAHRGDRFQIISIGAAQGAFYSTWGMGRTSFAGYRIA